MLGTKRNNSVFQSNDKVENKESDEKLSEVVVTEEIFISEVEKRADELMIINNKKNIKELGSENRTHSLFFAPKLEDKDFSSVLKDVQEYISREFPVLITGNDLEDAKGQMKRYIGKYVIDERIAVKGMDEQELVDAIYTEMVEYGFLTKYIFGKGIEEIDSATRS